jgi:hypothetical protein
LGAASPAAKERGELLVRSQRPEHVTLLGREDAGGQLVEVLYRSDQLDIDADLSVARHCAQSKPM